MRIRSKLALSYLGAIFLTTVGAMVLMGLIIGNLAEQNLKSAEKAVNAITDANYRLSERILTSYGERTVEMKAKEVAAQLSVMLGGRKRYDYKRLRRNKALRKIATQDIYSSEGIAGYVDVLDNKGVSVWHKNKKVEGRNFSEWKDRFPVMWIYVQRSFTEGQVQGYYTFVDRHNRTRKKYMVLAQVPRTPLIVAAVVNIDDYFLPVHEKIRKAGTEATKQAEDSIASSADQTGKRVKLMGLAGGAALLSLGGVIGLWLAGTLSRPIRRLRDGVKEIGEGNFSAKVSESGSTEVKELAQSFNQLGERLTEYVERRDFLRDTFGRYLTQEVVNRLLESKDGLELGGESREITIIMSDVRGFTALTAGMSPDRIIAFLNRYLGRMIEILLDHQGIVDEIVGDGILAFFGAPESMDDHPGRAVACALAMQAAMDEINAFNEAEGLPHLEMGIAINTGAVVVGNIGSERRTKYGVVGSNVNFTGRMESYAVGGQVLVSGSTYERLSHIVEVENVLEVEMKGVRGTVDLYDVRGIAGPYDIHLAKRDDRPTLLDKPVQVHFYPLDRKTVTRSERAAAVTHLSATSAVIVTPVAMNRWENVKIQLLDDESKPLAGEIYAKIVDVKQTGNHYESVIRFTSVSPEVGPILRQAIHSG